MSRKNEIEIEVFKRYRRTGFPEILRYDGIEFKWHDWVLCHIAWASSNPIHWCIASSFRDYGHRSPVWKATIWNPSYDELYDFQELSKLHYFKPIKVIKEVRESP